jgi:large subunit ribosomal protein L21
MYAVIRAGGKQYRVTPGDIVQIEKLNASEGETVEFSDVLAVSGQEGHIGPGQGAVVSGQVTAEGRGAKVLVFHFKRKKQYKKIFGHRQPFTSVRITEIAYDGQTFKAPDLPVPKKKLKPELVESGEGEAEGQQLRAEAAGTKTKKKPAKKSPAKAKKAGAKKAAGKKKK